MAKKAPHELLALTREGRDVLENLPSYEHLQGLSLRLRSAISMLHPVARRRTEKIWHGDPKWDRQKRVLDATHHILGDSLGIGLRSPAEHVYGLAMQCQALADIVYEAQEQAPAVTGRRR